MADMTLGFIGGGHMATALMKGLIGQRVLPAGAIHVHDISKDRRMTLARELGVINHELCHEMLAPCPLVVLAVKPQFFEEVIGQLRQLGEEAWREKILVSLAPGKSFDWFSQKFGYPVPMVRCMPNTPALVGEGCTGMCVSEGVSREAAAEVRSLTDSFGRTAEVPERLMDVVSAVSGSSPAFVFLFIEALADGAVAGGMPRAQAYELAAQAVLGSAKMVLETGKHPGELKDMVCSPGGTTIQGVHALEEKGFRAAAMDAVAACLEKARKL